MAKILVTRSGERAFMSSEITTNKCQFFSSSDKHAIITSNRIYSMKEEDINESLLELDHRIFPEEPPFSLGDLAGYYSKTWSFISKDDATQSVNGYIFAKPSGNKTVFVGNFGVAPECTGCGIGGRLMNSLIRVCKEKGVSQIELQVRTNNANAIQFYTNRGFELAPRSFASPGFQAMVLRVKNRAQVIMPLHKEPYLETSQTATFAPEDKQPLLSRSHSDNVLNHTYLHLERWHLFKVSSTNSSRGHNFHFIGRGSQLLGDRLKKEILDNIVTQLKSPRTDKRELARAIRDSAEYQILNTGQGLLTRTGKALFGMKTESRRELDRILQRACL